MCYFFFPQILNVTSSKNRLPILWCVLPKLLFAQKENERERESTREQVSLGKEQREGKGRKMTEAGRKKIVERRHKETEE